MNREEIQNAFLAVDQNNGKVDLSGGYFRYANFVAVVRELPPLPLLTELDLSRTFIGNGELAELTRFDALQTLVLSRCEQIPDEGLGHLKGLNSLQMLDLGGCTQITDAGRVQSGPCASARENVRRLRTINMCQRLPHR